MLVPFPQIEPMRFTLYPREFIRSSSGLTGVVYSRRAAPGGRMIGSIDFPDMYAGEISTIEILQTFLDRMHIRNTHDLPFTEILINQPKPAPLADGTPAPHLGIQLPAPNPVIFSTAQSPTQRHTTGTQQEIGGAWITTLPNAFRDRTSGNQTVRGIHLGDYLELGTSPHPLLVKVLDKEGDGNEVLLSPNHRITPTTPIRSPTKLYVRSAEFDTGGSQVLSRTQGDRQAFIRFKFVEVSVGQNIST